MRLSLGGKFQGDLNAQNLPASLQELNLAARYRGNLSVPDHVNVIRR